MSYFRITGGQPLSGTITPMGNKNAALPLLAAALLTTEPVVLNNMPDIGDVRTKLKLLEALGTRVQFADNRCDLQADVLLSSSPDASLCAQIRTSLLLAGPLLARFGRAQIARPGGDRIGRRNLDTHVLALRALGVTVEVVADHYELCCAQMVGADLFLEEISVTGTEQAVLCAVLARGTTHIEHAATEPHVQDVCRALNGMGAKIAGIGTHSLTIEGVQSLHGGEFTISPDYMEVGSYIALAAATRSTLRIANAAPELHRMTGVVFARLGVQFDVSGNDIVVRDTQKMAVRSEFDGATPKIDDLPWPGFPADLISVAVVLATQCEGAVLIAQRLFDRRLVFVDRLIEMGAGIVQCDPHRVVVLGPTRLKGIELSSPDIRAGMALLIAGLAADGETRIHNIAQIDRGYERLEMRLAALGADIQRVSD